MSALKFKVGQTVEQVLAAPVRGVVTEQRVFNDDVSYHVEFVTEDGKHGGVWFTADELTGWEGDDAVAAAAALATKHEEVAVADEKAAEEANKV